MWFCLLWPASNWLNLSVNFPPAFSKGKKKHPKKQDFLPLPKPLKSLETKEKRSKKQGIPRRVLKNQRKEGQGNAILDPLPEKWPLIQCRKCAINNFWTKNPRGLLGWGSRGSRQIIYVRIFANICSVFGTLNRPNINNFRDRQLA